MNYCTRCVLPDTRPGIVLGDDGVCNACQNAQTQQVVDWTARQRDWQKVVSWAKGRRKRYDCVIPVSGGKDSTWQTIICLESGLHPLGVTWRSPARTALGRANLDNLIQLGVDHIDFSVNPKVEKKFMLETLKRSGSPAIPMHLALFNIPPTVAAGWDIPLVVWGENSAVEYGGSRQLAGERLTGEWLREQGVSQGTQASDWVTENISAQELASYTGPGDTELKKRDVRSVFLGHYFRWDPQTSLKAAKQYGFRERREGPKTGYYNFADVDDDFISIHHWLKWYKFGITRLFDNLSLEIRRGRMDRDEAIEIICSRGDQTPHEDIAAFCSYTGITTQEFFAICEEFRNTEIWEYKDGTWVIPDFLVSDWQWS